MSGDRDSGERSEHATEPAPIPRQKEGAQRARPESTAGGDVHDWGPLVGDLAQRKERALGMGGPDLVERQHSLGKLTVRERLEILVDPGTWVEYGLLADHMDAGLGDRYLAADGAVTGVGEIDGRLVAIAAYDFTVLAGSMGRVGEDKIKRLRAHALDKRMPMVWLLDSAGARIQATSGSSFAGAGDLFREQVAMSGVVPMVAAMLGHCAAGTAYIPGLADFVPMVKGTSSMALGGRHLVKAAVGEDVTEDEMGGSGVHTRISGVADLEVADDRACLETVRRYLSFFPSHNREAPPTRACTDPVDRRVEELYDIVPTAPRRAYDVRKVVTAIVDDGDVLWMKPDWAKNLVTGLARIGGAPIGVVANQPMVLGGALDVNAADKAARFVWLCDAFNIPLVFLHDVPGFIVGSAVEKQGIIRHGAKMLFAVSEATVPKISVVMRKSYGAGYFVMNGLAYEADYIVAWPTAEIAVMGPDGAVAIIHRRTLEAVPAEEQAQRRLELAEEIRANIDPYVAAGHAQLDDVIDPADTRAAIARGLAVSAAKRVERPWRKHGVLPV
jgi:acetyl-CoA carboxylase carboxyltransferase component